MTKTIRVSEAVYREVESEMCPRESFSETLARLLIELHDRRFQANPLVVAQRDRPEEGG